MMETMGVMRLSVAGIVAGLAILVGCGSAPGTRPATESPVPNVQASAELRAPVPGASGEIACAEPVVIVDAGRERGAICPADAATRGLTIVDLRDAWTPSLFSPGAD